VLIYFEFSNQYKLGKHSKQIMINIYSRLSTAFHRTLDIYFCFNLSKQHPLVSSALTFAAIEACFLRLRLPVLVKKAVNDTTAFIDCVLILFELLNLYILKCLNLNGQLSEWLPHQNCLSLVHYYLFSITQIL